MKEVRLTLRAEDFGAIWASLLEMGIAFYVEPRGGDEAPARETKPPAAAGGGAKPAPAKPLKEKPKAAGGGEAPASGAERLRAAMARREGPDLPAAFGEAQPKSDS
ncbi:MAG: hypothetical protein U1E56_03015 [Bauldia sp.]